MGTPNEKLVELLDDLAQVYKKHGVGIGGCGCCDSPYIYPLEDLEDLGDPDDMVEWVADKYDPAVADALSHLALDYGVSKGDFQWPE